MALISPLALAGLVLAVPILLMYMLRLRRRDVPVSSTFLWTQLLEDREANMPWQKLRRNLLLLLQLLCLLLLVLALARPFVTVPAINAARVAVLLDASASMGALDGAGGGTRFADAQNQALALLDALDAQAEVSIIRVADAPEVLLPYSLDHGLAGEAVRAASEGVGGADWLAALTLASAGGHAVENFTIVLVTDGGLYGLDGLAEAALPARVRVLPVGTSGENVAFSALAARALAGGDPQLFAQITNYGDLPAEVVLTLRADDDPVPVFSRRLTLPAGASQPFASDEALTGMDVLHASLTTSVNSAGRDLLAADNNAWAVIRAQGERRVLIVSDGNLFLEQVFRSLPALAVSRIRTTDPLPADPFDLYVFDSHVPPALPAGDLLFIGPRTGASGLFDADEEIQHGGVIDAAPDDERMAFVDFDAVSVLKYRRLGGLAWADTLVRAGDLPLIAAGERAGRRVAVFAFALSDSDLPLQIAFPILMANLLDWFTPTGSVLNPSPRVGEPVIIQPPLGADTVRITLPDGSQTTLPVEGDQLLFTGTAVRGVYHLESFGGGQLLQAQPFAVNLFSAEESRIAPREVSLAGEPVAQQAIDETGQWEFWPLLVLLALAVLMVEWAVYHRRTRLPSPIRTPRARRSA